eukprot:5184609-Ditylum_brightwellii.AAC.1
MLLYTSYGGGPAACPPVQAVGHVGPYPPPEQLVTVPVPVSPSREPYPFAYAGLTEQNVTLRI